MCSYACHVTNFVKILDIGYLYTFIENYKNSAYFFLFGNIDFLFYFCIIAYTSNSFMYKITHQY